MTIFDAVKELILQCCLDLDKATWQVTLADFLEWLSTNLNSQRGDF